MRVLGIDPGSQTMGWGVVEGDGRRYSLIACGAIRLSSTLAFSARLLKICNGLEEVIVEHRPDACALEDAFLATNVKVSMKLGQVRGVVLLIAERAALEIHEYSPRLIKQTVVGYGNAEKHQVQEMVRLLLSLKSVPSPHDAADALAVAICHSTTRRLKRESPRFKARPNRVPLGLIQSHILEKQNMNPHKLTLCLFIFFLQTPCFAQKRPPAGGRLAVVVDERLAALRATPQLNGRLVRRLGRGRLVAVRSLKASPDGIAFLLVNLSRRTHGWIQREAVVSPTRSGDDQKLLTLIQRTDG